MAIIKEKLGNRLDIIKQQFRTHYSDGTGGLRFDAFCMGWKEGWAKCAKQSKAENKRLKEERDKYRNDWISAADDASYYHCIFDGSWPNAIEILTKTLEKIQTLRGE